MNDSTLSPAERLLAFWKDQGLTVLAGADAASLAAFEREHGVLLPAAFRAFLAQFGGVAGTPNEDAPDDFRSLIEFWPLTSLKSLGLICPSSDGPPDEHDSKTMRFAFADYLLNSHYYAIQLAMTAPDYGSITLYAGEQYDVRLADTFEGFVDLFFREPDTVISPAVRTTAVR